MENLFFSFSFTHAHSLRCFDWNFILFQVSLVSLLDDRCERRKQRINWFSYMCVSLYRVIEISKIFFFLFRSRTHTCFDVLTGILFYSRFLSCLSWMTDVNEGNKELIGFRICVCLSTVLLRFRKSFFSFSFTHAHLFRCFDWNFILFQVSLVSLLDDRCERRKQRINWFSYMCVSLYRVIETWKIFFFFFVHARTLVSMF
jgi:phage FluMu protein Com